MFFSAVLLWGGGEGLGPVPHPGCLYGEAELFEAEGADSHRPE